MAFIDFRDFFYLFIIKRLNKRKKAASGYTLQGAFPRRHKTKNYTKPKPQQHQSTKTTKNYKLNNLTNS